MTSLTMMKQQNATPNSNFAEKKLQPAIVYIVDDNPDDLSEMASVIAKGGYNVKIFQSGSQFLSLLPHLDPGCVVLDAVMPGADGLAVATALSETKPRWPVIMISGRADVPLAVAAMKRGAKDFVEKPCSAEQLNEAIGRALSPIRSDGKVPGSKPQQRLADIITPREMDVLRHLLAGQQNKGIAFHLGISERTVEVHRARLMRRLGVRSFAELIRKAVDHGLGGSEGAPRDMRQ